MATFSLPDEKGKFIQLNDGDSRGNLYATFGIDLDEAGKIKVSAPTKVFFDSVTETDLSNKILGFVKYNNSGEKILAFGGGDVYFFSVDAYSSYTKNSSITPTDAANGDGVFFDGLVLVSTTTSIHSTTDGSTWTNWWQTTLGQSALASSSADEPRLLRVGATGYLYISDNGNKIYSVNPAGSPATPTTSGDGTLDFSATNHLFTCMEPTSNRLWIGTKNIGGEAAVIEWDMSVSSPTANRIHDMGAEAVRAIVIYEDRPVAILSNGNVKIFNGERFIDWEIMKIRIASGKKLASTFIHRNGWAIIDDLPHIAITGQIDSTGTKYERSAEQEWAMPSGVYCMDPEKGLYHRFSFGTGDTGAAGTTAENYGEVAATDVGALVAIDSKTGKFLVSYETMATDTTYTPALSYHIYNNTIGGKGWLATTHAMSFREAWKTMELFHKPLQTGCSIKIYTRPNNTASDVLKGTWANSTTFNAVTTGTGIQEGNLALVKMGKGSGQWIRIASVSESSTVTSIVLAEANTFITAGDKGTLEVFDFKYMGVIDDTTRDEHLFTNLEADKKRKRQFLFEFTQPASTEVEIDYVIVNT